MFYSPWAHKELDTTEKQQQEPRTLQSIADMGRGAGVESKDSTGVRCRMAPSSGTAL